MGLPKKVAVLMGGPGSEREVSLATGRGVLKALRSLGLEAIEVDVRGEAFDLPDGVDLGFIAVHGTFGEDGQIQRILEKRGVAYTGEGAAESEMAFNKITTKERLQEHGVPTPEWEVIGQGERPAMSLPFVIKAPREGSTVGVYIIKSADKVGPSLEDVAKYDREFLIEKFIPGRELTVGVLGTQALPIIEIIPKGGFYDFTNKYPFLNPQAGGSAQHICPAKIEDHLTSEIQEIALSATRALGLKVYCRVDVLLPADNRPTVLEINTIPGMTEASLLPEAAAAAGISYVELCRRIIELSSDARGGARS